VPTITFDDFARVDIRVGTVVSAAPNQAARKPSYVLEVDFGPEIGTKTTSAQLTELYTPEELVGRQVAAVVNFPPKRIAKVLAEVLVLGFPDASGHVVLHLIGALSEIGETLIAIRWASYHEQIFAMQSIHSFSS
jgi:tRNA-binding protein